jgi:hypothetical protein
MFAFFNDASCLHSSSSVGRELESVKVAHIGNVRVSIFSQIEVGYQNIPVF